jgi:hypothetical protein
MSDESLQLSPATTQELLDMAREYLFHYHEAFTEPIVARAQGATLWDRDGRAYLDCSSGQMCATIGHNHPRIVEALQRRRIGRMNGIFAPSPAPPASAGGRGPRAASAAPPARCDGPRKRRAARRGTAWRALDRQVRMREEGRASGGSQGRGPRDGPAGKAEGPRRSRAGKYR